MSSDSGDDEPHKKKPKTATEKLIAQALAEDQARKDAKKAGKEPGAKPKKKDGLTFAEIEQQEGGPVKESLVGMAHVKRATTRKDQEAIDSTDVPGQVDQFEEKAQVEEEEGVKFTGFNLDEERETGYFDDDGNYVENKEKPDPAEKDAWMASDEAKVVSDEVRKKIEARRKAEEEESKVKVAPLTDRQIAMMKVEMASHMQAGESLAKAMKRLGAGQQSQKALGKRDKQRQQQQQQQQAVKSVGADNAALFLRMTELADQLLVEGEVDIYDSTKEEFERFAAMWMPKQPAAAAPAGGSAVGPQASRAAAAAGGDDDDDMFAEADQVANLTRKDKTGTETQGTGDAAVPRDAAVGAVPVQQNGQQVATAVMAEDDGVDYSSWPVKELKRFLKERNVDPDSFVEKSDMVARVKQLAAAGPSITTQGPGTPATGVTYDVPLGYAFDPASGYYHNSEVGIYFDTACGYYYSSGTWYMLNPDTGSFTAVPI